MVRNGDIFLISSIRLTIKRDKGKKSKEKYAITLKIFAYAQTPETLRFFQPETEVNNGQRPGAKRHRLHRFTLFPENNRKRSNKNAANNNEKSWNPNKKKPIAKEISQGRKEEVPRHWWWKIENGCSFLDCPSIVVGPANGTSKRMGEKKSNENAENNKKKTLSTTDKG